MFEKPELTEAPLPAALLFAVFGSPIAHSKSPQIHRAFARQFSIQMKYLAIEANETAFPNALAQFVHNAGVGANITLPLKRIASAHCADVSKRAARAGVVNTLKRVGRSWYGDNTDGAGLVRDLTARHAHDIRGRRSLILGAGGAVAGVLDALLDAGVGDITIANRNPARADQLIDHIGEPGRCHSIYWQDLNDAGVFDLIINGTAAGHFNEKLELPFSISSNHSVAYDLSYGAAAIDFLAWARASGCSHVHDGLGMLVEQAAEAFELWHAVRPETNSVFAELNA